MTSASLHATSVAVDGRGILITGASGRGKSSLALALMAHGALLISDDLTLIARSDRGALHMSAPPEAPRLIEARGMGLLRAGPPPNGAIPLQLVVDLDRDETERLPPFRTIELLGKTVPCLHRVENAYFPAMILQYVRGGREA